MILFFPGRPDGTLSSLCIFNMLLYLLGSCLMDMAKKVRTDRWVAVHLQDFSYERCLPVLLLWLIDAGKSK